MSKEISRLGFVGGGGSCASGCSNCMHGILIYSSFTTQVRNRIIATIHAANKHDFFEPK